MENLFRLTLMRPAVSQDPEQPSIQLDQASGYQDALRAAVASGTGRQAIEAASAQFAASDDFVQSVDEAPLGQQLDELADRLDALEAEGTVSWQKVRTAVKDVFGSPAGDVVDAEPFRETVRRLRDSLIAIKVLQQLHGSPIEGLARQLRTAELLADVAARRKPGQAARRRRRSFRLPVELELNSRLSTRDAQKELQKQRRELVEERQKRIGQRLCDPSLRPPEIAAAANISVRYLHKIFEAEHRSVSQYIKGLRLERSRRELLDPRLADRPIAAVAFACGFGDLSGFNRAFKDAYGTSPRQLRTASP